MNKKIFGLILSLAIVIGLGSHVFVANAGLYDCYQELGLTWQSVEDRAPLAASYGIWGYKGSAEQNNLLASYLCPTDKVLGAGFSVATGYQKTLRTTMTSSQTTVPVSSLALKDGTALTTALLGSQIFLTLEPGKAKEEIVLCTGITASPAQFTGCTRGLAFSGTSTAAVAANQKTHGAGSIVVLSNVHYVYEQYVDTNDKDQTIAGDKTASGAWDFTGNNVDFDYLPTTTTTLPTTNSQLSTKLYVDTVGAGGFTSANIATNQGLLVFGTAPETAGVYVRADKGMVTSTTGIYQSIKTLGGLVQDSNGLSITTTTLSNAGVASTTATNGTIPLADGSGKIADGWLSTKAQNTLYKSFTAGEDVVAGNAVSLGTGNEILADSITNDSTQINQTAFQYRSMLFTTSAKIINLRSVAIKCDSNDGSGNHTVTLSIRAVSGGLPTGADLGSKSTQFTNAAAYKTLTFASPITLSANTTYAIVVTSGQTLWWYGNDSSGSGVGSSTNGTSWSAVANQYRSYKIYETQTVAGRVYKSDASLSDEYANNFIGFSEETITAGNSVVVDVGGVTASQTGLTTGSTYYLSDTSGAIATSAGSQSRKVGLALSATEVLIKHDNP